MIYVYAGILGMFGAIFGSFAAAQVWRLRARQLRDDLANTQGVETLSPTELREMKREYTRLKPLLGTKLADDRSRCLSCGHELGAIDLLPIVSWLSLGGKCRYCRAPIGRFEFLMEVGVGVFFAGSLLFWPYHLTSMLSYLQFGLWLAAGVILAIQVGYDAKWYLLLSWLNVALAIVGGAFAVTQLWGDGISTQEVVSLVGSLGIMSGLYFVLNAVSGGQWIGRGDVELGVGLGLLLVTWQQALIALFAANLIGCLFVIPGMISGKLTRKSRVPFGPFLVLGTIIGVIWGQGIWHWYMSLTPALFL